jgi:hypothetical protein
MLDADFAFIQKPITRDALTQKVREVLDMRRAAGRVPLANERHSPT